MVSTKSFKSRPFVAEHEPRAVSNVSILAQPEASHPERTTPGDAQSITGQQHTKLYGVVAKLVGAITVAQLSHHFTFYLTNTLTGKTELASDLVERAGDTVVKAIA